MQGLHTGNYTFQVRMLDMAGNLGNATQLYAFAVDASLPLPGSESAGWFSGWHKWAIIAGAAALGLLLLLGLSGACYLSTRRARQVWFSAGKMAHVILQSLSAKSYPYQQRSWRQSL